MSPGEFDRVEVLASLDRVKDEVREALDALRTDQRLAVRMRVIDERPYATIAQQLGISDAVARAHAAEPADRGVARRAPPGAPFPARPPRLGSVLERDVDRRRPVRVERLEMLEWSGDVSAADWIVDRLRPFGPEVGSLLPDGLAAYARVLHPAWGTDSGRRVRVRWAELASPAGVRLEVTTRFEELEGAATTERIASPQVGTLDLADLRTLVGLLAAFTSSSQSCWFAWWEGYGWMQGPPAVAELGYELEQGVSAGGAERFPPPAPIGPRVEVPERALVLYRGPISGAAAFCRPPASQSPNLWWPDDHAWCIASEIDFRSTYLGGSQALIDRLLEDKRFEALPARLTDRVTD